QYGAGVPLPEVHSPFQRDGDVADVGVFPNPKYRRLEADETGPARLFAGMATSRAKSIRLRRSLVQTFRGISYTRRRVKIVASIAVLLLALAIPVAWHRWNSDSRIEYFAGTWRFERKRSAQWTGGACATSDVQETVQNDLVIEIPAAGTNTTV